LQGEALLQQVVQTKDRDKKNDKRKRVKAHGRVDSSSRFHTRLRRSPVGGD
jgi:hypothetical protein